jgi:hypothetical protein
MFNLIKMVLNFKKPMDVLERLDFWKAIGRFWAVTPGDGDGTVA